MAGKLLGEIREKTFLVSDLKVELKSLVYNSHY